MTATKLATEDDHMANMKAADKPATEKSKANKSAANKSAANKSAANKLAKKGKRRCTAMTQDGEPCQAWARRGSEPALCAAHTDQAHGEGVTFYSPIMKREELAALADLAEVTVTLEGEIACARILIRRLIAYMNEREPEGMEMLRFAKTVFKGTAAVARMLEKEHTLRTLAQQAGLTPAIYQALDELAEEWGIDL